MKAGLISIIGPPAVGKTTLAERLAELLPAAVIYEDYAGNPFLADSYTSGCDACLPAQLYYLISRTGQLSRSAIAPGKLFVSDYGFCQDRIFAEVKLSPGDLAIYEKVLERMADMVRPPDLLIRLDASEETLLERIADRGRAFERSMTAEFISSLRVLYNGIDSRVACPVLDMDCDATDLRERREVEVLAATIRERSWT